jgi:predicted Zn-dependent protease
MLMVQGCATGSSEVFLQSVEKDVEQGRETAKLVEVEMGIANDPRLTDYLQRVGIRIAKANPDQRFEYNFQILDQFEPNAFALPGGWVFVSRGLLALTENEDELANVLGHEVVHVSNRHSARQQSKALLPTLLSVPGAIVGGVISQDLGNLINMPVYLMGGAYLAAHSRQDEYEADQLGQVIAAGAGYDPGALAPILSKIEAFAELQTGEQRMPGFFDTHPSTPNRTQRITDDATQIAWQPLPGIAERRTGYLRNLDGLLVGANPEEGVFLGRNFLHPVLDLSVQFPKGWKTINTRQAVFAVTEKQDAALAFGIEGKGTDPQQPADKYRQGLKKQYGVEPTRAEKVSVGGLPAYLLTYTDTSAKEPMCLCFLWIAYREAIYRFVGFGPQGYHELLRETAFSFRPMTPKEKASITETRLRIATARSGETLTALSKRTGNQWDDKTTAVVNGLEPDRRLKKGQLVKVAVRQPYTSSP